MAEFRSEIKGAKFERFFYFLEQKREHGILVFDQVDKGADLKFVRQIERYFKPAHTGRYCDGQKKKKEIKYAQPPTEAGRPAAESPFLL